MDSHTVSWVVENFRALSSGHHGGFKNSEYLDLKSYARSNGKKIAEVAYETVKGRTFCARCGGLTGFNNAKIGYSKHCDECKHLAGAETRRTNSQSTVRRAIETDFEVLSPLENGLNSGPLLMVHKSCGHEFEAWMNNGKRTARCPKCSPSTKSSYEYEVRDFLEKNLGEGSCVHSYRIPGTLNKNSYLEIDVFVPSKNVGIEINGLYWHGGDQDKNRHRCKVEACEKIGVKLIQFTDEQWNSKRDLCESMLLNSVGLSEKIRASKCELTEVSPSDYRKFCEDNHMEGYAPASVKYGLRYSGELVQVMSFSKPRFGDRDGHELIRLCTKKGTVIRGGASRLFKKRPAGKIVSYSYDDLGTGGVYYRLGFVMDGKTPPGYFWYKNGKTVSRYQSQKHRLSSLLGEDFDPRESESENMRRAGYERYWNSGNTRWLFG